MGSEKKTAAFKSFFSYQLAIVPVLQPKLHVVYNHPTITFV